MKETNVNTKKQTLSQNDLLDLDSKTEGFQYLCIQILQ